MLQPFLVLRGERKMKLLLDDLPNSGEIRRERPFGRRIRVKVVQETLDGDPLPGRAISRKRLAQQAREEFGAALRNVKERLVQEMLDHGLAPDVDDEGDVRTNLGDVREILFGPDPEVGPARDAHLAQLADDVEIRCLVGSEVVGTEVPILLGQVPDESRELRCRQALELLLLEARLADWERGNPGPDYRCGQREQEQAP